MKEGFLLSRIASQRRYIIRRHTQMPALVEANFANATLALFDETAMSTGIAFERVAGEMLGEFRRAFRGHLVQNFSE
jgi:hypothetical protein